MDVVLILRLLRRRVPSETNSKKKGRGHMRMHRVDDIMDHDKNTQRVTEKKPNKMSQGPGIHTHSSTHMQSYECGHRKSMHTPTRGRTHAHICRRKHRPNYLHQPIISNCTITGAKEHIKNNHMHIHTYNRTSSKTMQNQRRQ